MSDPDPRAKMILAEVERFAASLTREAALAGLEVVLGVRGETVSDHDYSGPLGRIYRGLNDIQLVADDERMPQELTDQIMERQRAIKAQVDLIAQSVDYKEEGEAADDES